MKAWSCAAPYSYYSMLRAWSKAVPISVSMGEDAVSEDDQNLAEVKQT